MNGTYYVVKKRVRSLLLYCYTRIIWIPCGKGRTDLDSFSRHLCYVHAAYFCCLKQWSSAMHAAHQTMIPEWRVCWQLCNRPLRCACRQQPLNTVPALPPPRLTAIVACKLQLVLHNSRGADGDEEAKATRNLWLLTSSLEASFLFFYPIFFTLLYHLYACVLLCVCVCVERESESENILPYV
jgi:hypothetical protein